MCFCIRGRKLHASYVLLIQETFSILATALEMPIQGLCGHQSLKHLQSLTSAAANILG
jgi:hypothetical protein